MVQISRPSVISACLPSSGQSGPGWGDSAVPQWGVPPPPHPQVKVSTSWQGQGRYYYVQRKQLLGASGRTSGEYCYMYMYLYRNTQLSQSSKERIKGMLFHVLVCTRSSTIKHAYSKAPGTIQRILLHVFTICITLIYINFYFISPFHLSVCLSTEKIWFKSNIHVYSYMNLMSLN